MDQVGNAGRAVALVPRNTLELGVTLDPLLQSAWEEAVEWARGPALEEICIRDFLRGLVFSAKTWPVLERDHGVRIDEARQHVARDRETGERTGLVAFRPSQKLKKLLFLAAARSFVPGDGVVTIHHVVEALGEIADDERLSDLFPELRQRRAASEENDRRIAKEREALVALAGTLPGRVDALAGEVKSQREAAAGERLTTMARLDAIARGLEQLRQTVMEAPGLDVRVDKLRESFGNLHDRLDMISGQCAEIARGAGDQRTALDGLSATLAQKSEAMSGRLDELSRPWWRRLIRASGRG